MAGARIQLKRATAASWASNNPVLYAGEIGLETDTNKFKIGDGTTAFNSLSYFNGNLTGSSLNDLADVTIVSASNGDFLRWNGSAWINDAVNLSTDTVGNYMVDVAGGTGVTISHTPGEGSTASVAIGQDVATSASVQFAKVTAPVTGNLTGNADTATTLQTSRTISLSGDVSGSVSFNGSANVNISATIQSNSVALGTDTTGNYIASTDAVDGMHVRYIPFADVASYAGEYNGGASYAIGVIVSTGVGSPYGTSGQLFVRVSNPGNPGYPPGSASWSVYSHQTSPSEGCLAVFAVDDTIMQVRVADVSDTEISYLNGVTSAIQTQIDTKAPIDSPTFTGIVTLPDDTVALGTKTTGDYVSSLVAGTGVTLTNNSGETATPTVAIGQDVATSASVTFAHVSSSVTGNVIGDLTGNADTATTLETARVIELSGDVTGSVSFDGSTNVNIVTTVVSDGVELGVNTTGNYMVDVVAGTGVTVTHTPGEGSSASVAIGQDVATSASVEFAALTVAGLTEVGGHILPDATETYDLGSASARFRDIYLSGTSINLGGAEITSDGVTITFPGGLTGDIAGNADTASELETARIISLGGDLSGSVSFDGSQNVTITAQVEPNSVALGTDTTGNFMSDVVAGTGVSITHTPGESSSASIGIGQAVGTTDNPSFAGLTADGVQIGISNTTEIDTVSGNLTIDSAGGTVTVDDNLIVSGNLTVNGTSTSINTETLTVDDNIIVLNNNATGAPSQNAGIQVERGDSNNVELRWNETTDSWEITEDGTTYRNIAAGQDVETSSSVTFASVTAPLNGNASTATTLQTARTISVSGDISGSVSFNGSSDVNITATVQPNSIALGTDTTGNYLVDVVADSSGITVNHTASEGSSASLSLVQNINTSASVTFANVTADLVGDVTGNADTATTLQTARAISLGGDLSGSVSFDGSQNVTITAAIEPNSVALGTDTTGNFVNDVIAGTGVTVSHTPGEGSSASIAIGQDVATTASVTFAAVTAPVIGNASTATTLQTSRAISLTGDLSGSVSFDGSQDVSIAATVQPNSVALGTDTTGNYVNDITAGTGVSVTHTPGEGTSPTIAIGQAVGTSASVTFANVTADLVGDVTGNSSTATTLETSRTISLAGDVSGSVSFNGSSDASITATIQPNSVALGTDTTGNYVNDVTAGTGVTITHTPGEGSSPTVAIGQDVATSASVTFAKVDTTGDLTVGGNLTVNGTTTTLNTETLSVEDNIVVLNSNATGSPALNAGIEVERGDSANVVLRWNESTDKWETTNDGSAYSVIATNGNIALGTDTTGNYMSGVSASTGVTIEHTPGEGSSATISIGQSVAPSASVTFAAVSAPLIGNVTGDVSGNSGTATALQNSRVISLGGDLSGSVSFNGTSDVTITASVEPNSVALGTDTTGNYMSDLTQGTGVTITHTPGEGSNATIAIGQAVGTSSSVTFAHVSAPITGNVTGDLTGNAGTATALQTSRTINLGGDLSGSASFNGTSDVTITATVQPNSVALGADTTGNFVSDVVSGTGVTVTHTPGESSSASIAIGQDVATTASVTFAHVSAPVTGNVTGNVTGDVSGNAGTATALQNSRAISLGGDLSGSVSFNGTSDVTITATVQPDSVALGTDTTGNYMSGVTAGTGITVTHTPGEGSSATIAIGQAVGASDNPSFAGVTADGVQIGISASAEIDTTAGNLVIDSAGGTVTIDDNLIVSGDLTVNGTTTTVNTETINLADNLIVLNSNETGAPSQNAGLEIERGSSTNVALRWNEISDKWELTEDGSTYVDIATVSYVDAQTINSLDEIGDVSTASAASGDFLKWNGSAWVNDPINLGSDTVGNYVNDVTAGTGVTVTHTPSEGSSPTIAIGQAVGTSSSVTFAAVTAPLIGNVTGNADTATALATSRTIELTGDVTGSVSFNGSANASITATIAENSVALGTDTTGNYVSDVTGGTGVTVTHTPGEGSSPSIAIGQSVATSSSVQFEAVELGHASDTTLSRSAAGRLAVEGVNVPTISSTDTLTNKTLSSATLTGTLTAGGGTGTSGQFLKTTGTGVEWAAAGGAVTTTSVTANTETTVATFTTASAKAAEFHVKVGQGDRLYSTKVLALHNGTTADFTKYGELSISGLIGGPPVAGTGAVTWVTRTSRFGSTTIFSVAYGNNLWVAGGYAGQLRTSTDAITWVTRTSNFGSTTIFSVAYGNNLWVAGGYAGQIRTSTDAITWVTRTSNFGTSQIDSVAYGNALWVAGGYTGQIRTSTDAITWVTRTSNFGNTQIDSVAYGNVWVAGGRTGQIRTSTDAITWVTRTSNFGNTKIDSVAYGNVWVAGGRTGQLRTSTDAITWTTRVSNFGSGIIFSVAYGNNLWVAVGQYGQLRTSTDAITWVTQTSNFGNTESIMSVAYGNNLWVAGGDYGRIMTSATDIAAVYVGGLTSSASVVFNTNISGSDVRLRMTIPDAATTNATVKVLTTTVSEN